jgi:hypothetical protein
MFALLAVMMAEFEMSSVLAMMSAMSAVMAELVAMSGVIGVISVVLAVIAVVCVLYRALQAIFAVMAAVFRVMAVLVVIAAVLPWMGVARGDLRVINLSTLIVFSSKSTSIRDRMAGVFTLADAHASISHANAYPEPLHCGGEFPERISRSLCPDSSGSETAKAASIEVPWHSLVCAGR